MWDALEAWWPLNGDLLDYSGNDRDFSVTEGSTYSFVDGFYGSALSQDETALRFEADVPHMVHSMDMAISFRFKFSSANTANLYRQVLHWRQDNGTYRSFDIWVRNATTYQRFYMDVAPGGDWANVGPEGNTTASSNSFTIGRWYHFVYQLIDGSRFQVWVDGNLIIDDTSSVPSLRNQDTGKLGIGKSSASFLAPTFFKMQDLRSFSRSLAPGEIMELYRSPLLKITGREQSIRDVSGWGNENETSTTFEWSDISPSLGSRCIQSTSDTQFRYDLISPPGKELTAMGWFNIETFYSWVDILRENGWNGTVGSWDVAANASGTLYIFYKRTGDTPTKIATPNPLTVDTWYHIAIVVKLSEGRNILPNSPMMLAGTGEWDRRELDSVTEGIDDPFGGNTAFRITPTPSQSDAALSTIGTITWSGDTNYIWSCWLRTADGSNQTIGLSGTSDAHTSGTKDQTVSITGEWARYNVVLTTLSSPTPNVVGIGGFNNWPGDVAIDACRPQLEQNSEDRVTEFDGDQVELWIDGERNQYFYTDVTTSALPTTIFRGGDNSRYHDVQLFGRALDGGEIKEYYQRRLVFDKRGGVITPEISPIEHYGFDEALDINLLDYGGGGTFTIQAGELQMTNNAAVWDQYLFGKKAFRRDENVSAIFRVYCSWNNTERWTVGWRESTLAVQADEYDEMGHGFAFTTAGVLNTHLEGAQKNSWLRPFKNGWYDFRVDLKTTGADFWFKHELDDDWTMAYEYGTSAVGTTFKVSIVNYSDTNPLRIQHFYVVKTNSFSARRDGILSNDPTEDVMPENLTNWWPLNGDFRDIAGGSDAVFSGAAYDPGQAGTGYQWVPSDNSKIHGHVLQFPDNDNHGLQLLADADAGYSTQTVGENLIDNGTDLSGWTLMGDTDTPTTSSRGAIGTYTAYTLTGQTAWTNGIQKSVGTLTQNRPYSFSCLASGPSANIVIYMQPTSGSNCRIYVPSSTGVINTIFDTDCEWRDLKATRYGRGWFISGVFIPTTADQVWNLRLGNGSTTDTDETDFARIQFHEGDSLHRYAATTGSTSSETIDDNYIGSQSYSLWTKPQSDTANSVAKIISRDASDYFSIFISQNEDPSDVYYYYSDTQNASVTDYLDKDEWHHMVVQWWETGNFFTTSSDFSAFTLEEVSASGTQEDPFGGSVGWTLTSSATSGVPKYAHEEVTVNYEGWYVLSCYAMEHDTTPTDGFGLEMFRDNQNLVSMSVRFSDMTRRGYAIGIEGADIGYIDEGDGWYRFYMWAWLKPGIWDLKVGGAAWINLANEDLFETNDGEIIHVYGPQFEGGKYPRTYSETIGSADINTRNELWIDGVLAISREDHAGWNTSSRPVVLGCNTEDTISPTSDTYVGEFQDVRRYQKHLSSDEILRLYNHNQSQIAVTKDGKIRAKKFTEV